MSHQPSRDDSEFPQSEPKRRKSADVVISPRKPAMEQSVRQRAPETQADRQRDEAREQPRETIREPVREPAIEPPIEQNRTRTPEREVIPDDQSQAPEDGLELNPEIIDDAFSQILMCDDDDKSFSRSIVMKYFEQAEETFPKLHRLYENREMKELSETGHFLKSSSAVIGVRKVKDACEKIQHYASLKDINGSVLSKEKAIELLAPVLSTVEARYKEAKNHLMRLYD